MSRDEHPSVGKEFPQTTWGSLADVSSQEPADRVRALEALCTKYWKPICHFLRSACRESVDDAMDLTQDFLLWVSSGEVLSRYEPARGSFRAYLKGVLRLYLSNERQARRRLKRGGGKRLLSFDEAELSRVLADPRAQEPDSAFDLVFVRETIAAAMGRTRAHFASTGRTLYWRAYEAYDLGTEEARPTYAALAGGLGCRESDVRNWLHAVRKRLREEVRRELLDVVQSPDELESEWKALFE